MHAGLADLVAWGRLYYIYNPEFRLGTPLATPDPGYYKGGEKGFADYSTMDKNRILVE